MVSSSGGGGVVGVGLVVPYGYISAIWSRSNDYYSTSTAMNMLYYIVL